VALLELNSDANEVVEVDMTTLHAGVPDSLSTTQEGLVFKRLRLYCVVLGITILESKTYSLYFLLNSPVGLQKIIHLVKVELRPNIFVEHRVCHKNVRWLTGQTVFDQTSDNEKPFKRKVGKGGSDEKCLIV